MRTTPIGAAMLALALVAAGCGADAGGDDVDTQEPAAQATELEITVWPEGEGVGEPLEYTLRCHPPGGGHPDPVAACEALGELGASAFDPVPPDVMCTQQYGGPQQAHVRGTVDGTPVDARLAYTDGCEIDRWNRLSAVVPGAEGALR